jgi:hypothetical protein
VVSSFGIILAAIGGGAYRAGTIRETDWLPGSRG